MIHCTRHNTDIDSSNKEILEDCPSGPVAEHCQPAKTINAPAQQRKRAELRRKKLADAHREALVTNATVNDILRRNADVEAKLLAMQKGTEQPGLQHSKVDNFLLLSTTELQDFIHARSFTGKTFQKTKLADIDSKLNKVQ